MSQYADFIDFLFICDVIEYWVSPIKYLELTSDRVTHTAEGKFGQLYEVRVAGQVEDVEVGGLDGPGEAGPVLQAVAEPDADPGRAGWYGQWGVDLKRDLLFYGALTTISAH